MQHQNALKPCPFCGSENVQIEELFYDCSNYWVQCQNCNSTGSNAESFDDDEGRKEAAKLWNTRTP